MNAPEFSTALQSLLEEVAPDSGRLLHSYVESAMRRLFEGPPLNAIRLAPRCATEERNLAALASLTAAERELLHLACLGWGNKEIAAELEKSIRTVKTQLTAVYKKLRVRTRARLLAFCSRVNDSAGTS